VAGAQARRRLCTNGRLLKGIVYNFSLWALASRGYDNSNGASYTRCRIVQPRVEFICPQWYAAREYASSPPQHHGSCCRRTSTLPDRQAAVFDPWRIAIIDSPLAPTCSRRCAVDAQVSIQHKSVPQPSAARTPPTRHVLSPPIPNTTVTCAEGQRSAPRQTSIRSTKSLLDANMS
jgi:hypothetical protein